MKSVIIVLLLIVGTLIPPGQAQVALRCEQTPRVDNLGVSLVLGAGSTTFQLCSEEEVVALSAFTATVGMAGAPVLSLAAVFTVSTISAAGCTFGGWTVLTNVATVASSGTASSTVTMTASHCRAIIEMEMAYGTPVVHQVRQRLPVNVDATATSFTVDNLNRFCASSAIGAACTTPSITINDDIGGWAVHQDPICTSVSPCHQVLSGNIDSNTVLSGSINSTTVLNGNVSFNQTNLPPAPKDKWDGSLYILLLAFVVALAHLGELRRDNVYRAAAGFILMIAAVVSMWELERVGFNNVSNGYGLGFAVGFLVVQFFIGLYLLIPKDFDFDEKEKET